MIDTRRDCSVLAEITGKADTCDASVGLREGDDAGPGVIMAAVIDQDKLEIVGDSCDRGLELQRELRQRGCLLVVHGHDDRNVRHWLALPAWMK